MSQRPTPDPAFDLRRIRKEQSKTPRARLRIVITTDPSRPIRTISLPASLPTVVLIVGGVLALATIILACGSWKLSDTRYALERRVRAMVQAADSVALGSGNDGDGSAFARGGSSGPGPNRPPAGPTGRFMVQSSNNGEELEVRFNLATGEMEAEGYRKLRHLMRCLHTTAESPIDPRLIELLYAITQRTGQKIILVSGFRAPMYSRAKLSYHTRGMAADIRIPGLTPLMARDLAESMGVPGLGYYPVSGFIHVDVREYRSRWIDYGQDRMDGEGAEHDQSHSDSAEQASEPDDTSSSTVTAQAVQPGEPG